MSLSLHCKCSWCWQAWERLHVMVRIILHNAEGDHSTLPTLIAAGPARQLAAATAWAHPLSGQRGGAWGPHELQQLQSYRHTTNSIATTGSEYLYGIAWRSSTETKGHNSLCCLRLVG
jgi:hypothetical protein